MTSEKELNKIVGKLSSCQANKGEVLEFLAYVEKLEEMVEEASNEDFYGTEGYKHRLGWD